jgi:hypothetical protein
MNDEGSKQTTFDDYKNMNSAKEEKDYVDAEEIPQFQGICEKCLGSSYRITERNGVMGVLFTSDTTDSEGKPIRRLIPCDCGVEVTY